MFHPKTLRKNLNYTLDVLSLLIFKSLFFLSLETTFFFPRSTCPIVHMMVDHQYLNHTRPLLYGLHRNLPKQI